MCISAKKNQSRRRQLFGPKSSVRNDRQHQSACLRVYLGVYRVEEHVYLDVSPNSSAYASIMCVCVFVRVGV